MSKQNNPRDWTISAVTWTAIFPGLSMLRILLYRINTFSIHTLFPTTPASLVSWACRGQYWGTRARPMPEDLQLPFTTQRVLLSTSDIRLRLPCPHYISIHHSETNKQVTYQMNLSYTYTHLVSSPTVWHSWCTSSSWIRRGAHLHCPRHFVLSMTGRLSRTISLTGRDGGVTDSAQHQHQILQLHTLVPTHPNSVIYSPVFTHQSSHMLFLVSSLTTVPCGYLLILIILVFLVLTIFVFKETFNNQLSGDSVTFSATVCSPDSFLVFTSYNKEAVSVNLLSPLHD